MVFLQAAARRAGPAARLLIDCAEAGRLALLVSDAILDEVRDVLNRPRIRSKNPAITDEAVERFCMGVLNVARKVDDVPALFALVRDPDDGPYLNLAIFASADYLVTRDNDLLDLMRDTDFRGRYPTLTILDPISLLKLLDHPDFSSRPSTVAK
jgi:putative PIN family toxin of toxin-antitoxin system